MSEKKKALITRTKPETAAPTYSKIFLPGYKQNILFLTYRRLATAKRPFSNPNIRPFRINKPYAIFEYISSNI